MGKTLMGNRLEFIFGRKNYHHPQSTFAPARWRKRNFSPIWRFNSLDDLAELRFGQNQRDFWTFADLCEVLALLLPYQMATKMLTNHFGTFNLNFTIKLQSLMAGNVGSCANMATVKFQIFLN